ncbi:hypothetical protein ACIQM4_30440 [Streptomyces sp. NPDC091272]|uniref:hypothetical protein n=1 Tax=Streptomyces sp. NPDC091272 TaxID=3365981 RepID=UPI0037F629B2
MSHPSGSPVPPDGTARIAAGEGLGPRRRRRRALWTSLTLLLVALIAAGTWRLLHDPAPDPADLPYALKSGPKVTLTYAGSGADTGAPADEGLRTFLQVLVQRIAEGDTKEVDALAQGYPDGAAVHREQSDFPPSYAQWACKAPVSVRLSAPTDTRPLLTRLAHPGGGTATAELSFTRPGTTALPEVRVELSRTDGIWWGYVLD